MRRLAFLAILFVVGSSSLAVAEETKIYSNPVLLVKKSNVGGIGENWINRKKVVPTGMSFALEYLEGKNNHIILLESPVFPIGETGSYEFGSESNADFIKLRKLIADNQLPNLYYSQRPDDGTGVKHGTGGGSENLLTPSVIGADIDHIKLIVHKTTFSQSDPRYWTIYYDAEWEIWGHRN